ncbi:MAG: stage VI sporulation protein F [Bacilli bacterium]|nr:stage VI sporulation protein F [Bacilli bacterium]MDD7314548.1 stage VI sporulation protein F [Bacilli bacterium]MDY4052312.1 stage VI sporulation protein F [Bacilli bacterium]
MNINKVMSFISENNIQPDELFALVERVRTLDLTDESCIRKVIRDVSKMANKPIDKAEENKLVREIMKNGVNESLLDILK